MIPIIYIAVLDPNFHLLFLLLSQTQPNSQNSQCLNAKKCHICAEHIYHLMAPRSSWHDPHDDVTVTICSAAVFIQWRDECYVWSLQLLCNFSTYCIITNSVTICAGKPGTIWSLMTPSKQCNTQDTDFATEHLSCVRSKEHSTICHLQENSTICQL